MPTINAMLSGTYSMYRAAQSNGTMFQSASAGANANNQTLSGLTGLTASTRSMLESYSNASGTFYTEFDTAMGSLKDSARAVMSMDFKMGKDAVTKTENEDGTTTTKKSDALVKALKAVESLASDYNDAIDFLGDNSDVSRRVSGLGTMFSDTTYRSGAYESIGLMVDAKTGKMSIDEDRLTQAIMERPETVSTVLGKNGLAGKADSHASFANSQRSQLFPSVNAMLGDDLKASAVYSGKSLMNLSKYASVGSLLNLMG